MNKKEIKTKSITNIYSTVGCKWKFLINFYKVGNI